MIFNGLPWKLTEIVLSFLRLHASTAFQDCILSPCLFNLYAEYITRNTGLDEAQAGIKIAGRNINILSHADHPFGSKERGTKEPLDESEREE